MSSERARVSFATRAQWSSGVTLGFEPRHDGGFVLRPTPSFSAWVRRGRRLDDATQDAFGRTWCIEWSAEGARLVRLGADPACDVHFELPVLGVEEAGRLIASGTRIWLLDRRGARALALDAETLQLVDEVRTSPRPIDLAVDGRDVLYVLHRDRVERVDRERRERIDPPGSIVCARALALHRCGRRAALFVALGRGGALVRLDLAAKPPAAASRKGLALFDATRFRARRLLALPGGAVLAVGREHDGRVARCVGRVFDDAGQCCGSFGSELAAPRSIGAAGAEHVCVTSDEGVASFRLAHAFALTRGRYYTRALDSGPRSTRESRWHRLDFDMDLPPGMVVDTQHAFTSDAALRRRLDRVVDDPALTDAEKAEGLERELSERWSVSQRLGASAGRGRPSTAHARSLLLRADEDERGEPESAGAPLRFVWLRVDVRSTPDAESTRGRAGERAVTFALRRLTVVRPRASYLDQLPAVYRDDEPSRRFLERFLSAFERSFESIERHIDHLDEEFDAALVPLPRLEQLANWLGVTLDADWDERTRRAVVGEASLLAKAKGTPAGIARLLELVLRARVSITESRDGAQPLVLGAGGALGGGVSLASVPARGWPLGEGPLGARSLGVHEPTASDALRASAWRAVVHVDLPADELERRRATIESALQVCAPAHVDVEISSTDELRGGFVIGARLREPSSLRVGAAGLGRRALGDRPRGPTLDGCTRLDEDPRLG